MENHGAVQTFRLATITFPEPRTELGNNRVHRHDTGECATYTQALTCAIRKKLQLTNGGISCS